MIRGRRTKGESFSLIYQGVSAITIQKIDGYSLYLIEYLCSYVSLI